MRKALKFIILSFIFSFMFVSNIFADTIPPYPGNPYDNWWERWGSKKDTLIFQQNNNAGATWYQYSITSDNPCFIFNLTDGNIRNNYYVFTSDSTTPYLRYNALADSSGSSGTKSSATFNDSTLASATSSATVFFLNLAASSTNGYPLYADFTGSWADLEEFLIDNGGSPVVEPDDDVVTSLPSLTYTLSFNAYTSLSYPPLRYNGYIKWDFNEKSPYSTESNNFIYDVRFADTSEEHVSDIDKTRVYKLDSGPLITNSSSFSCYDLQKKIQSLNFRRDDLCIILIRAVTLDGKNASPYTAFSLNFGNFGHPNAYHTNAHYDNSFNPSGSDGTPGIVDDTTGKDTSDTETSASKNPDSDIYKTSSSNSKLDTSDVISGLKTAVNSVTEVVNLLKLTYSWFPDWLINLISVSVALLVIVGLIKLIIS